MPFNIPILLTWIRVILIPVFVILFYLPSFHIISEECANWLSAIIFTIAAITDWFDGYLARKWQQTSSFGAFLDPVADKLMVTAALLVLINLDRVGSLIALLIIGREITISALREWMAKLGASGNVAVHWLGKFKTAAQMIAIPCLIYGQSAWGLPILIIGEILIIIAAILTVWSMFYYLRRAWPVIAAKT